MRKTAVAVALASVLALAGCSGSGDIPPPEQSPSASATAPVVPTVTALAQTLTRIERSRDASARVACAGSGELRVNDAVRCTLTTDERGSLPVFVSILHDNGRFVFSHDAAGATPDDYVSTEISCKVLYQPPGGAQYPGQVGLDYTELRFFWNAAGSPLTMDDDRNGVPCETVYPAGIVARTLGSPLRVQPYPTGPVTLEDVRRYAEATLNSDSFAGTLSCSGSAMGSPAVEGSAADCRFLPDETMEGFGAGLAVLDATGQFAMAFFECCDGGPQLDDYPAGSTCEQLRGPPADGHHGFGFDYRQTLYWWMRSGMPSSLDSDGDGRPCEEAYPAADVVQTFSLTLQPPATG